jgi:lipoyl(octanoyl) transferase
MSQTPQRQQSSPQSGFAVQDFGLSPYETIWAQQTALVEQRLADQIGDTLLLGEHPPVITLGRNTHAENLLSPTMPVVSTERGGDVTYHGPGQLIAYPVFLLPPGRRDLHRFLRNLEEVIILSLAQFGLQGVRNPGWTGVWVPASLGAITETGEPPLLKIASIGVAVRKWVTYHGLALNVNPDLSHFAQINPCGLQSEMMTSMQAQLEVAVSMAAVKGAIVAHFQAVFGELWVDPLA